jgi:glutamate--cysteine ligase
MLPEITQPTPIELPNGQSLLLEPLVRTKNRLGLDGFDPCAILLNNDLSAGIPDILQRPATNRSCCRRSMPAGRCAANPTTFAAYDEVANDFAKAIGIDPWRINPAFSVCRSINFHERQGEECLAANVAAVLDMVKEKYKEYGIDETPYVVVKADAGTYGMGVMTVRNATK